MKKISIFASGSGSNAENIINHFKNSQEIMVNSVVCNVADAFVLERAKRLNVHSYVITKSELNDPDKVLKMLKELETDYIVLAGFLLLMPNNIVTAFPERIINIHPALLPAYGGKGMYGMKVHKAVIDAGEKVSGITIHFVDEKYDNGKIILQKRCDVTATDTPESLAEKVHILEYEYYPIAIEKVILNT
ncbi:MAG: phosphoribosylglycinamide formyltransferase [Culturomica sp.]|jgi:phosphoribosylglycinamide formyltransferase-1|nr:phosphoribosylglycinamide formyltransferase [Culturomica sp.]